LLSVGPTYCALAANWQHRPKNKLVNEAVAEYVTRQAYQTDGALRQTLKRLQSYQKTDPDFAKAIDAFGDAEAKFGKREDSAEGEREEKAEMGKRKEEKT